MDIAIGAFLQGLLLITVLSLFSFICVCFFTLPRDFFCHFSPLSIELGDPKSNHDSIDLSDMTSILSESIKQISLTMNALAAFIKRPVVFLQHAACSSLCKKLWHRFHVNNKKLLSKWWDGSIIKVSSYYSRPVKFAILVILSLFLFAFGSSSSTKRCRMSMYWFARTKQQWWWYGMDPIDLSVHIW